MKRKWGLLRACVMFVVVQLLLAELVELLFF